MKTAALLFLSLTIAMSSGCKSGSDGWISAAKGLRMRDKPSLNSNKIGLIPYGEKVRILKESGSDITISGATGKWTKVEWNGQTGWAFGGFISKTKASETNTGQISINDFIGKSVDFIVEGEEAMDGVSFSLKQNNGFHASCLQSGMGEAVIDGRYTYIKNGNRITVTINGVQNLHIVAETEEYSQDKVNGGRLIIYRKNGKYYGSINLANCMNFSDKELSVR